MMFIRISSSIIYTLCIFVLWTRTIDSAKNCLEEGMAENIFRPLGVLHVFIGIPILIKIIGETIFHDEPLTILKTSNWLSYWKSISLFMLLLIIAMIPIVFC